MKAILKDKRFILLLVSLSILLLTVAGFLYWKKSTYDPEKYNAYLKEAEYLLEDMQYANALDKYLLAVDTAPREYPAYEGLITLLSLKNRFEDAQKIIDQVELNLTPDQIAKLYILVGNAKYEQEMYSEAFKDFSMSYRFNASDELIPILVDSALKSDADEDINDYVRLLPEDSSQAESLSLFDQLSDEKTMLFDLVKGSKELLENGYANLALNLLEPRVDDMAEYWDGKYLLGRAYYETGEFDKAVGYFQDSVALGADDANLYWYLARTEGRLKKSSESYKYYDRAILYALDEQAEPIVTEYVSILIKDKQYSKALDIAEMFVDTDFGKLALMNLYIAQAKEEELDELLTSFEPGEKYQEGFLKSQIAYREGSNQLDKISTLHEKLKGHTEDQAYLVYCEGLSAEALEEPTTAAEKYKRAIDIDTVGEVTNLASDRLTSLEGAK